MTAVYTYAPTTPGGKVRLLISDTDVENPERCVFSDDEITAFLSMNCGVKRAAAAALSAIAGNQLQVDKVIKTQDLQTDAAKVAEQLRSLAKQLREEADREGGALTGAVYLVA